MAYSAALEQTAVRNQIYLERLKSGEANQFASFLKLIDSDIRAKLSKQEITEYSMGRLNKLLTSVNQSLSGIFKDHYDELSGHLFDVAEYEAEFEGRAINSVGKGFESVLPSANQVRQAVFSRPLSVDGVNGGKLLKPFIKDWQNTDKKRITNAVRMGYFQGETNKQIIQRIRGTRARKYSDGLLAVTKRNAEAIVRTSVQHAANQARSATWDQNKDVVKGYRWVSTLDSRTSTVCRSLDGRVFDTGKGPIPPAHIRCRSTTVAELSDEFAFLQEGRSRASKAGPIKDQNHYDWLKSQSKKFQDDNIGPTLGKLLRDGGLTGEQFARLRIDQYYRPLTIKEMKLKEPLAFERAEAG